MVVGAGFGGLYMVHRLREAGLSVQGIEAAGDVGGTWWWNRYPGARCDIPSLLYSYTFSDDLQAQWRWSEKYATQPEILAYAQHVADRFDLRPAFLFETRVVSAVFDEAASLLAGDHRPGRRDRRPLLRDGHRLPVGPARPGPAGRRDLPGRDLCHRPVAARADRLHRQAGGGAWAPARRRCSRRR